MISTRGAHAAHRDRSTSCRTASATACDARYDVACARPSPRPASNTTRMKNRRCRRRRTARSRGCCSPARRGTCPSVTDDASPVACRKGRPVAGSRPGPRAAPLCRLKSRSRERSVRAAVKRAAFDSARHDQRVRASRRTLERGRRSSRGRRVGRTYMILARPDRKPGPTRRFRSRTNGSRECIDRATKADRRGRGRARRGVVVTCTRCADAATATATKPARERGIADEARRAFKGFRVRRRVRPAGVRYGGRVYFVPERHAGRRRGGRRARHPDARTTCSAASCPIPSSRPRRSPTRSSSRTPRRRRLVARRSPAASATSVLPGFTAFTPEDARAAGARCSSVVRCGVKPAAGIGGRGQIVVDDARATRGRARRARCRRAREHGPRRSSRTWTT